MHRDKNKSFAPHVPGDVNEELSKFLSADDGDSYGEYAFALLFAGPFRCREERLVCAADQFVLCTFSSGLFSYFELQSKHAASGVEAFTELGLPQFAQIVSRGLELLSLDANATSSEIETASAGLIENSFDQFLDEAEPLEDFVYDNAKFITSAVIKYVHQNSRKLWRNSI